jgi:hypothetical protein
VRARRFGPDFSVLTANSPGTGLDAAADLHLPGLDGVDFLERAHALHPPSTPP